MIIQLQKNIANYIEGLQLQFNNTTPNTVDIFDDSRTKLGTVILTDRKKRSNITKEELLSFLTKECAIAECTFEEVELGLKIQQNIPVHNNLSNSTYRRELMKSYNMARYNYKVAKSVFKSYWNTLMTAYYDRTHYMYSFFILKPKFINELGDSYIFEFKYNWNDVPSFKIPKILIRQEATSMDIINILNEIQYNHILKMHPLGLSTWLKSPNLNCTKSHREDLRIFIKRLQQQLGTPQINHFPISKVIRYKPVYKPLLKKYNVVALDHNKLRIKLDNRQITITFHRDINATYETLEAHIDEYLYYLSETNKEEYQKRLVDIQKFYANYWYLTSLHDKHSHFIYDK